MVLSNQYSHRYMWILIKNCGLGFVNRPARQYSLRINSPRQKGLTDICEAFLHGKEHTTSGSPSCPHFTPGRYALYFPFFSALK